MPLVPETVPTAQTLFEAIAATPVSLSVPALEVIVQCVPFQCSINGWKPLLPEALPTAQMSVAEMAEIADRPLLSDATLGLGTMLHMVPFQCSMSVSALFEAS